ncbi:hypothetical protein [Natrinema sp. DC36]|uniref:hypothetical protein n=1 Tax=Natrinema sp. DC36 TaxID=2878680 RepID=UPI001CF07EB9|nr:hypothetical protein [Natrinema sp. DC36]
MKKEDKRPTEVSKTINRRAVLNSLGATAGASIAGLGMSSNAKAKSSSSSERAEKLSSGEARKMAGKLRATDKFEKFKEVLRDKLSAVPVSDDVEAAVVELESGSPVTVVKYNVNKTGGKSPHETIKFALAQDNKSQEVRGLIQVLDHQPSGDNIHLTVFESNEQGVIESESRLIEPKKDKTSLANGPSDVGGTVTTQSLECDICTGIGDILCSLGCGLGSLAACAVAGFTGPQSSLICGAIATSFCAIIPTINSMVSGTACTPVQNITFACEYEGYC